MNSDPKIVTVIQARIGSSRLPGKVLLPLAGKPLLIRLAERVKASELSGKVVIAIPDTPSDNLLYDLCISNNLDVFRGDPADLLSRHYNTALHYKADAVVKIPSDCPLIDPDIITRVIDHFISQNGEFDYMSNLHPPTYPDGNDVEIFTMEALTKSFRCAVLPMEREHTTPYMWDNPENFRIGNVTWEAGLDLSMRERWTIDYEEDYHFIRSVYDELYIINPLFSLDEILSLLDRKPELRNLNKKYLGVIWYRNHLEELKTIKPNQPVKL